MTGLGVGCVGWHKQRPQRGQCGGRVGAIGGGEGVEHIRRRRLALIAAGLGDDKAKLTGHALQGGESIFLDSGIPCPSVIASHAHSIN